MLKFRTPLQDAELSAHKPSNNISPKAQATIRQDVLATQEQSESTSDVAVTGHKKRATQTPRILFGVPMTRARKRALVGLGIATAVGVRWSIANAPVDIPLRQPQVPKLTAPNAANFYAAAADAFDFRSSSSDPVSSSLEEKKQIVNKAAPGLKFLRQGFAYPYQGRKTNWYAGVNDENSIEAPVPNFVGIRTMARVLGADAEVAAAEGRYADGMSASLDALQFGQDVAHGNAFIDGMIGLLCQGIGLSEGLKNVNGLTAEEARTATNRTAILISKEQTFTDILEQERTMVYATMAKMMTSSTVTANVVAAMGGSSDGTQSAMTLAAYNAVIFWYGKDAIFRSYRDWMDTAKRQTEMPYQEVKNLALPVPTIPFLSSITPNYQKAFLSWTKKATLKRILLARLAVQAYKQENGGKLPSSLDTLTEGVKPYLLTVPIDLYSPDGKQPLRYKNGVVYSVGENGKDDGNTGDDAQVTE